MNLPVTSLPRRFSHGTKALRFKTCSFRTWASATDPPVAYDEIYLGTNDLCSDDIKPSCQSCMLRVMKAEVGYRIFVNVILEELYASCDEGWSWLLHICECYTRGTRNAQLQDYGGAAYEAEVIKSCFIGSSNRPLFIDNWRTVFLSRRAAAQYRSLASIIPGREKFSWNLSF